MAACFSTESDLLSQWWAYGGDGTAFAVGIDPSTIASFMIDDGTFVR